MRLTSTGEVVVGCFTIIALLTISLLVMGASAWLLSWGLGVLAAQGVVSFAPTWAQSFLILALCSLVGTFLRGSR